MSARGEWALRRGAKVTTDGVRFSVWAPRATEVAVRTETGDHALKPAGEGLFEGSVSDAHAGTDYRYVLDRGAALPDPASRFQPDGVHGASRVVDPAAFNWTDDGWRGIEMPDYIIYELHVGTFTEQGTFEAVIAHLAGLRALGITAIEIMPVGQFPGPRNWGYDGTCLYAPQNSYGGPEGLRRLVNEAHSVGLAVILDVVYNHVGPEGNYLDAFAPYFTDVYRTPWGRAINYDGPDSDEVRRFVIDNALYWVSEFHFDALRLDAIHGIYDFGATHVLAELTREVHELATTLGRTVCLVAESDLNDPKVVRSREQHGLGFDAQWSDDLHHAVHAALTGETAGYYSDFGGVAPVAAAFREPFVYSGGYSRHRRRRHGSPAAMIPRDRFVVCIQNHDQVGNRAAGDRLSTLVSPSRLRLAAALLLFSPYVPLLFMGEEYGETHPFAYFVSHGDAELLEAVRNGRRAEFASFGWGDSVPDPASESTFVASKLDRSVVRAPEHAALLALYHDLLHARHTEPALRPGDARVALTSGVDDGRAATAGGWMLLELTASSAMGQRLAAAFNLTSNQLTLQLPAATTEWTRLLDTSDARYRSDQDTDQQIAVIDPALNSVTLPAESAVLLATGPR